LEGFNSGIKGTQGQDQKEVVQVTWKSWNLPLGAAWTP